MPDYSLLIFDLDGTLQDSMAIVVADINHCLAAFGLPPMGGETRTAVGHMMIQDGLALIVGADSPHLSGLWEMYLERFRQRSPDAFPLFDGVREGLSEFQARSLPMAIATAKATKNAERDLNAHQLRHFFGHVMGGDSAPRSKPHPDMLHAILERTGAEPTETLYIGDAVTDIEMGLAAGVWTCGVSYGVHGEERLRAAGAHHILHTFPDLRTLLP